MKSFEELVESFQSSINRLKEDARDKSLDRDEKDMYRQDARNLQKVLTQFKRKKFKEAMNKAYNLDTACRECIPNSCWNLMMDVNNEYY